MKKLLYIVLITFLLAGCTSWSHIGTIVHEKRNGRVCDKVYNSSYELMYNSCDESWKE